MRLYRALHLTVPPILRLVWRLEVEGQERVPSGPLIVVANHDSLADPVVLGGAFPRPLRFLAKQELWSNRLVRPLLDALGGIPVARARGDVAAVEAASRALQTEAAVAIFPQGTTLGPPDRPWQRGAARLALTTGAPIVPVGLVGTRAVLPPGRRIPRRAVIRVLIGAPIVVEPQSPTIPATRELTARLRAAVEDLTQT